MLAGTSASLAIGAHGLAHGGLPDTAGTLLLTALVGWIGAALADRTRGPLGLLAILGAAQAGMHLVLGELMGHGGESWGMFVAHAAATLVAALVQAHAESMLRVAVARLRGWLPVVRRPAPVAGPRRTPIASTAGDTPVLTVLLGRVHRRRGPPLFS